MRSFATRALTQSHRWLGIVLGLVVVVWFASGIGMMYVGDMPALTPQERLEQLPDLDLARVQLTPAQAAERLGDGGRSAPVLMTILGRPAYRFPAPFEATVFADDGALLEPLDEAGAAQVARRFLREPASRLRLLKRIDEADQWTLSLRRALPLLKYAAGDAAGTHVYVSTRTAEVVQVTTRRERTQAWIATIPHWLYFSTLRQNQPLWYRVVVGLSALACLLALLGLVLAFTQWRRTKPLDLKRAIPYRGGMRWHYITGACFGVFVLTWAFSGLLSMEPFGWTRVPELQLPSDALGGTPALASYDGVDLPALPALAAPQRIKEVTLRRIHGEDHLVLRTTTNEIPVLVATLARRDTPFTADAIMARLRAALPPGAPVVAQDPLQGYDDYYYSRSGRLPLPVLRVKLGDPLQTWLYVETGTSQLVANVHRYSRVERWLYNGLHSLDFRFWYSKRPLWDLAVLALLLGGLTVSSLGLYYGMRGLFSRS